MADDLLTVQQVAPLAERLRPKSLDEVIGQEHLTSPNCIIRRLLTLKRLPSMILWGPPGSGKTTMARLIAQESHHECVSISAVFAGVAELRRVFDQAKMQEGTILFIDEIHRFNKAQQDALLGPIESGLITLIGATTENPSFSLNSALLSRARVLTVRRLTEEALEKIAKRAEDILGRALPLEPAARTQLINMVDGDGRMMINLLETLFELRPEKPLSIMESAEILQQRMAIYDKSSDAHYNLISSFIKSLRGSDPDAALYWMARMLVAGEDQLYLARRMIRFACEDVGLADPQALVHSMAALQAFQCLGSPEGELALVNSAIYLATAPKSNAAYMAMKKATKAADENGSLEPPKHILNAPTAFMKQQGYADGYVYDHDTPEGFSGQNYFPDEMQRQTFYQPVERGFERDIQKRLEYWQKLRSQR